MAAAAAAIVQSQRLASSSQTRAGGSHTVFIPGKFFINCSKLHFNPPSVFSLMKLFECCSDSHRVSAALRPRKIPVRDDGGVGIFILIFSNPSPADRQMEISKDTTIEKRRRGAAGFGSRAELPSNARLGPNHSSLADGMSHHGNVPDKHSRTTNSFDCRPSIQRAVKQPIPRLTYERTLTPRCTFMAQHPCSPTLWFSL